jgi:5'-nucleotidase
LAFSLNGSDEAPQPFDYGPAAQVAQVIARQVLERSLPANTLLNVNIPVLPYDQIRGYRIARQGTRIYRDRLLKREDPRGRPYYWIGGDAPTGVPEVGTDFGVLDAGFVSITPVQLDLTAYEFMPELEKWNWDEKK